MDKPEVLQIGPYPASDREPLAATFTVRRVFEADDREALLMAHFTGEATPHAGLLRHR